MALDIRSKTDNKISERNGKPMDANGTVPIGDKAKAPVVVNLTRPRSKNPMGRWWEGLGLLTKSSIVSVAAITIPLAVLGGFTYFYVGQNIANTTKQAEATRAQGMAYRVAYFMRERYGDIQVLAQLSFLTNPKVQATVSLAEQKTVLENYIKSYGVYDSIAVYRLDGSLVVDASPEPAPANISKLAYFQTVLSTDKPYISQPEPSVVTKKISIFIAAPVKDVTTGKTIAVIRTRVQAAAIEDLIKDFSANGEQYHLAESDGTFFVAFEKDKVGRNLKAVFPGLAPIAIKRDVAAADSVDNFRNKDEFVGYAPIPIVEGLPDLKWDAVIEVDTDIALKPLQQLLLILIAATGVVGLMAAILAIAIARRATRPVIDATQAVQKMGKGNLETRLAVRGQDEMAQLGDNINSMAGQLQEFVQLQEQQSLRSQLLAEISRSTDTLALDEPLSRYLEEIRQELQSDRLVLYRFTADQRGIIAAEAVLPNLPSAKNAGLSDPCIPQELLQAYTEGRFVPTNDVLNAGFAPEHLELMRKLQIKSNLVVPVLRGGELDSLLIAHHCSRSHTWQQSEIAILQTQANDIGLALSGLATVEQQQQVAKAERDRSDTLQRELMGLLGDVEGATSGDLTVRAQISAGEIGIVADFFNAIVESLRDVVTQVKQATAKVNTSVTSDNASIQALAAEANMQASQLDEALKSVEDMTESIQQVSLNAQQASEASSTAATTAETGSVAIEESVESILQLRQNVAETAKKVKRLGEASQQISKVVALIDQIALKTNMLAVNASIEAARAGEEGRGFAVVAEEVGALAAQSATATKEIGRIVENIQQETTEVVEAMEASTQQVVEGTNKVEQARKSLTQIVEVSRQVNLLFQGISNATRSQVQTSQTVKFLMQELSTQSQQSSKTSRQVSESLEQTVNIANQLQTSVETFKV
jgi:methyl-accepting chemotaxis protein PixJ